MKLLCAGILTMTGAVALGSFGCAHHHTERETVYVQQPVQPQPQYVVVTAPPPPPVMERRPAPPVHGSIWIDGYWRWDGRQYAWQPGYWTVPPRGYTHWAPPRYDRHGHEYRYTPGHWERR